MATARRLPAQKRIPSQPEDRKCEIRVWRGEAPWGVALPTSPQHLGATVSLGSGRTPVIGLCPPRPPSLCMSAAPVSEALASLSRAGLLLAFGPTLTWYDLISTELIKSAKSLIPNKVTAELGKHAFFGVEGTLFGPVKSPGNVNSECLRERGLWASFLGA